jgi:RNA polymerase sigma factor (sigma-70 family)
VFSEDSESELHNTIPDKKTKQPIDVLIEEENETILSDAMSALWNHSALSEKQKHQLKLYYLEDKTLTEIGKVYGVSREAIRQNIKRSLETIRQYDKCTT